jgi:ubiquinone/menaquinone biosynthesis C-methylase UbiE
VADRVELNERVAREKAAYDGGSVYHESSLLQSRFNHVFRCPNTQRAERFLDDTVAKYARGRDLLDYGCYNGGMALRYRAMNPRSITGIDISENGIAEATARYGSFAKYVVGDAHQMPFADGSFDLVAGRAILHHLDMDRAFHEICRVLRPGGSAIFMEPLGSNPGAKVLRAMTPRARTSDERALTYADIVKANAVFGGESHFFFNLISVPVAMLTSLMPLEPDNLFLRLADLPDRILAHTPLKYWMRCVVLVWKKG